MSVSYSVWERGYVYLWAAVLFTTCTIAYRLEPMRKDASEDVLSHYGLLIPNVMGVWSDQSHTLISRLLHAPVKSLTPVIGFVCRVEPL